MKLNKHFYWSKLVSIWNLCGFILHENCC